MSFAAVVLAAGRSTRMGGVNKLLAELDGRPLIRKTVANAMASQARPVIVVTGHMDTEVRAALDGLNAIFARNADYAAGMATSLLAGIAAAPDAAVGVVVLLGDAPLITPALIDAMIAAAVAQPAAVALVPTVNGVWAHPVLLRRVLFAELASLSGDAGARSILARRSDVSTIALDDPHCLMDADDPAALEEIRRVVAEEKRSAS